MAAQADIIVFDGATPPVQHIFSASGVKILKDGTEVATYREYISTLPLEACPTIVARRRTLGSGVVETRIRASVPVMESVAGQNAAGYTAAPKVAYVESDEWVKYSHPRSQGGIRNLSSQILRNVMNNVSTTVPPVIAGFAFEAIAKQIWPS